MSGYVQVSLVIILILVYIAEIATTQPNTKHLLSQSQKLRFTKKVPKFLQKHQHQRRLADDDDAFEYNLAPYGVSFQKCQYVKTFDDDVAQNKYISSVFSLKQFIVYRLCPISGNNNNGNGKGSCDSSCNSNYGEYVVDVADYLSYVVEQARENFEDLCEQCDKDCEDNNNNYRCSKCRSCAKAKELEENGYVDASTLTTCQQVQFGNDDDANAMTLYVGPRCYKSGHMIKIDVFSDYQCTTPYNVNVEDILGYKLHYYVLQRALGSSGCISCSAADNDNDNDNQEDNNEQDNAQNNEESLEFCQYLYTSSAKCETKHGFTNGLSSLYSDSSYGSGYNNNELSNEYDACTFIDSLVWNSYNQNGEISYQEPQDAILRTLTTMQRIMIGFLGSVIATIAIYANYLQKKIASHKAAYQERLMGGYTAESNNNNVTKSPPSIS